MKKCSSMVWKFFDRLGDESDRCIAVVCKLCNVQYKYFGNTTNLRVHLIKKHPIQWQMGENGNFDEAFHVDDVSNQALISDRKRSYKKEKNVDVLDNNSEDEEYNEDDEATLNMVRQMHAQDSGEEWLDDSFVKKIEGSGKRRKLRAKKIKREVISPVNHRPSTIYVNTPVNYDYNEEATKDEFSVFGEYIANKIRKFKTSRTRGNIQQMITTILWQAEYGMYDESDAVKRMLLFTVQDPEQQTVVVQDHENQMDVQHVEEVQEVQEFNQSIVESKVEEE